MMGRMGSSGHQTDGLLEKATSRGVCTKDLGHFWSLSIKGGGMIFCVEPFEIIVGRKA